ncbi:uncharacterized protein C8R40DRAFT_161384 [Lentinula edodes]|uniref:uncharacterized protein n=1 Tax=Lentinula edodes TaxID=5353 RepID=UPI001E8EC8E4|nr:uncharacterized protein C8R40DRAFT_161384 [Lentinula edodes]KAH7875830.1 hypothetical protein C8R40DRAFT_161384 [Lentinula edodes]
MSSETTPEIKGLIPRGFTESTSFARALFVLFRTPDLPLQYAILSGGTPIPPSAGPPLLLLSSTTNTGLLESLSQIHRAILFAMASGSFAKHTYWVTLIPKEPMSAGSSLFVGVLNAIANSMNTILFVKTATSMLTTSYQTSVNGNGTVLFTPTIVSIILYIIGMVSEWGFEIQRLKFEKDLDLWNKGRAYTHGFFGFAWHIN